VCSSGGGGHSLRDITDIFRIAAVVSLERLEKLEDIRRHFFQQSEGLARRRGQMSSSTLSLDWRVLRGYEDPAGSGD
jgi:hypothetical protein